MIGRPWFDWAIGWDRKGPRVAAEPPRYAVAGFAGNPRYANPGVRKTAEPSSAAHENRSAVLRTTQGPQGVNERSRSKGAERLS
jgi:hypothetical protein